MENNFINKAKSLARNPLGIIALFISMIYGFACLVLSASLDNLCGPYERQPMIWFIILFPLLILIVFTYLVVNHHKKLYAPTDFKDEKNFVYTFSQDVPSDLEKIKKKVDSLSGENDSQKLKQEIDSISKEIGKVKDKSEQIPINILWRLNHWGSRCATIEGGTMIFRGTEAPEKTDGSHIDLIDSLNLGKTYEISCFAKAIEGTTAMFQLWCHDKTGEPNGETVSTLYKTPSVNGEIFKVTFKSGFNRNVRIHLQYQPGQGKIEVSDVKISELDV